MLAAAEACFRGSCRNKDGAVVVEESNPLSARSGNSMSTAEWLRLQRRCHRKVPSLSVVGLMLRSLNPRNELSSGCKMTSSSSVAAVMSTSSNLGTAVGCRSDVDVLEPQNHPRTAVSPREALAESAVEPNVRPAHAWSPEGCGG